MLFYNIINNYLSLVPRELLSLTFNYLNKYMTIIQYAHFLFKKSQDISLSDFFENLFRSTYPFIYKDIKNVINDDIYLNNNVHKLSNWTVLYAIFMDSYSLIDSNSIKIDNMVELSQSFDLHNIIYRAAFNKSYPEIYNKIKVYESFNFKGLEKVINTKKKMPNPSSLILYWFYALDWHILYDLVLQSENAKRDIIVNLYNNLQDQDNIFKILEVLISYPYIKEYIINYTPIEEIVEMTYPSNEYDTRDSKREELFKFIYLNKIGPTEEYTWEYLISTAEQFNTINNFELFKWLLENGESTWIDNHEFDERYENIKRETGGNFKMYDELLELYKV